MPSEEPNRKSWLKRFVADAIGLNLVRHHDKAVVARRPKVSQVPEDDVVLGHSIETRKDDFGDLAPVETRLRLTLAGIPVNAGIFGDTEGFPLESTGDVASLGEAIVVGLYQQQRPAEKITHHEQQQER